MSTRPEQPEAFLRGCLYPPHSETPYPRARASDVEYMVLDVWQAAQIPVGVRLEFVGDAQVLRIHYTTSTANLGYRGEGAGCTFCVYQGTKKITEVEAVLGDGVVDLELPGEAERPIVVYLPEGMRPVVREVEAFGGQLRPAPVQPRWLAYGDAVTQGWLASSPAMAWPALVARKLGFDVCNLGYAGSTHGETTTAAMLAETAAEAVSLAIGHVVWQRAPHTPGMVAEEVKASLRIIRGGHPGIPIVVMSPTLRPDAEATPNRLGATLGELRLAVEATVRDFVAAGDGHLYLVEGAAVLHASDLADGVYPNDEGHKRLAAAVGKFFSPVVADLRQAALTRRQEEVLQDASWLHEGPDASGSGGAGSMAATRPSAGPSAPQAPAQAQAAPVPAAANASPLMASADPFAVIDSMLSVVPATGDWAPDPAAPPPASNGGGAVPLVSDSSPGYQEQHAPTQ